MKRLFLFLLASLAITSAQEDTLPTPAPGAAHFLKRYPQADTNKDGILTWEEQRAYHIKYTIDKLGGNYSFKQIQMPMRDGITLTSAVFMPEGDGPFSTVLIRTAYGIWAAANFDPQKYANQNYVFITQNLRGDGSEQGKGTANLMSFDNEINDGYDTIDWISQQPWSNGRVGMTGQSGHGFCAYMAYLSKHPNLTGMYTGVSGGNAHLYWTFHNGVRREMYNWMGQRGVAIPQWPKPTIEKFNRADYAETIASAKPGNKTVFIAQQGWYDIFLEAALDYFQSFAEDGKLFIQVDASGHGNMVGKRFPPRTVPAEWKLPFVNDVLNDPEGAQWEKSRLVYYLMGDVDDPEAPGNEYKMTDVWPVPHTPTPLYLHSTYTCSLEKPTHEGAALTFSYDPRDPVPSVGGDVFIHQGVGPRDQRELKDRKDILRFTSTPLTEPMEITGKLTAELYVSSDVPDTTFTAKLIDVYPDGYEAILKDSIVMGRYHAGYDKEAPMEKGKIYKLTMDMWSLAYIINKGHKIAVHISSSNDKKYEVHPNSFQPVMSFDEVPVAQNTIHISPDHPSHLVLPVVK